MKYIVFDLETTTHKSFRRVANPFDPRNKIVVCAWKTVNDLAPTAVHCNNVDDVLDAFFFDLRHYKLLIGQNIKFDLLYIWGRLEFQEWLLDGGMIYDTQLGEYLLTGQQERYASLDYLAEKYGGTLKDDRIKEMWKAGIDTLDIPDSLLIPYAREDITNTEIVALKQIEAIQEVGLSNLCKVQNKALLATTEIEYNGLALDTDRVNAVKHELEEELNYIESMLTEFTHMHCTVDINFSSTQQLSSLLFGGEFKTKELINCIDDEGNLVLFKSGKKEGQVKTKWQEKIIKLKGLLKPIGDKGKNGYYSTDNKVLTIISEGSGIAADLARILLKQRLLNKQLNTYLEPLLELVTPWTNCIHGELKHTSTVTGRLSSKNPNLQNISR